MNNIGRCIQCKSTVSERKGTFLDKAHISADKLLTFIALFLSEARSQLDAGDKYVWLNF